MCPDKSLADGGRERFDVRSAPSVDKFGNKANPNDPASTNPEDPNFISATGMGWFPGYAFNLETGERLNIMFGEDSWLVSENGRDMLFNPTSTFFSQLGRPIFGGKHYIYVMSHTYNVEPGFPELDGPSYDFGNWARNIVADPNLRLYGYLNVMYVNIPLSVQNQEWLSNDVTVRIRVSKPYAQNYSTPDVGATTPENNNWPMYTFTTGDIATSTQNNPVAESALDLINIVPNPYYGYSAYETDQLDNRVKITNLPEKCTISIYTVNGILVRQIKKDNTMTSVDWDLKNSAGIPIASGMYLIHVNTPGVGEKVIKWFGSLRPVDLNAF
jgi:hypothetical protein